MLVQIQKAEVDSINCEWVLLKMAVAFLVHETLKPVSYE